MNKTFLCYALLSATFLNCKRRWCCRAVSEGGPSHSWRADVEFKTSGCTQ